MWDWCTNPRRPLPDRSHWQPSTGGLRARASCWLSGLQQRPLWEPHWVVQWPLEWGMEMWTVLKSFYSDFTETMRASVIQCSAECGAGLQQRSVVCLMKTEEGFTVMPPYECSSLERPLSQQSCNQNSCGAKWYHTDWSGVSFIEIFSSLLFTCSSPPNTVTHNLLSFSQLATSWNFWVNSRWNELMSLHTHIQNALKIFNSKGVTGTVSASKGSK